MRRVRRKRFRVPKSGKGFTRNGKFVKAYWVDPGLIEDVGEPGKTPEEKKWFEAIGKLKFKGQQWTKGTKPKTRHTILNGLVRNVGYATTVKRLNALANVTTDSKTKQVARSDMTYLKKKYRVGNPGDEKRVKRAEEILKDLNTKGFMGSSPNSPEVKRMIARTKIDKQYFEGLLTKAEWNKKRSAIKIKKRRSITVTQEKLKGVDRRIQVVQTRDFQQWWEHRRFVDPLPADPYRAYMTDCGMFARREGVPPWRQQPNRFDVGIDFPVPRQAERPFKGRKRRIPKSWSTPKKTSPERDRLQKLADAYTERFKVPKVHVVSHPRAGTLKVAYIRQRFEPRGAGLRPVYSEIHLGTKGGKKHRKSIDATLYHELGHHLEVQNRFKEKGYLISKRHPEGDLPGEIEAWNLARPYLTDPTQHWEKRFALETYLKKGKVKVVDVTPR